MLHILVLLHRCLQPGRAAGGAGRGVSKGTNADHLSGRVHHVLRLPDPRLALNRIVCNVSDITFKNTELDSYWKFSNHKGIKTY